MSLTNRHSLPQAIITAMEKSDAAYDAGDSDRTVSSLHEPPRVVLLKQKHKGELSADASERVAALLGTAFHKVCELSAAEGDIVEKRFSANIAGWKISGAIDVYSEAEAHIRDWKVISVWSVVVGDGLIEYTRKLNTYAHLLRANGKPVEKLSIVALFRDWSAREARHNPDYPQRQVIEYDLDVWPHDEADAYVRAKVDIHQQAQIAFDKYAELVSCTPEDRWEKPTTFAVMKAGNKKASKVCKSHEEAVAYVGSTTQGMSIVERHGEMTRCLFFCPCRAVCEVGKSLEAAAEAAY